jgi:hypothetical protein
MGHDKPRIRFLPSRLLIGAALAGAAPVLAACGSDKFGAAANTFSVKGNVSGNANVVNENGTCEFTGFTFEPGQSAVLRGADNTILATDSLKVDPAQGVGNLQVCFLTFHFDKVKAGEAGYQLTVGSADPIVVTEHQLRDKDFHLTPPSPFALAGGPSIEVYPES